MTLAATDYGVFSPIISLAGKIAAMGLALILGWKGRAKWEPVEEDVPRAHQKVASLVAALMVVLIWVQWNEIQYKDRLTKIVIGCSIALIVSLLVYGLLHGFTYTVVRKKKENSGNSRVKEEIKVIGGLWLKKAARARSGTPEGPPEPGESSPRFLTVQRMFELSEYAKDALWSRPSQQFAKMLFTLGYLGMIIAGAVALGSAAILTGVVINDNSGPVPIVLMGSSNVRSFLWDRLPDIVPPMRPLWLDLGSGTAEKDIFFAFDYGALAGLGSKRVGLLALSSEATLPKLTEEFSKARPPGGQNDQTINNYWLNIKIGRQPMAIVYRGKIPRVESSNRFPPEGALQSQENSYKFVRFADLRDFIEGRSRGTTLPHLPEENTGTRFALSNASSRQIKWNERQIGHPVSSIETVGDKDADPFVLIVSAAPWSSQNEKPVDCTQLKQLGIGTAVICVDKDKCEDVVTAEFAVVMKVIPQHDALGSYLIGNQAECRIANALTGGKVHDCKVEGHEEDKISHIVELTAYVPSMRLPTYLTCPE